MGYETKLLIGKETNQAYDESTWFQIYAMVDLCKPGYDSEIFKIDSENKTPDVKQWYWYAPTGDDNIGVTEDRYGAKPKPVPLTDVIHALRLDMQGDDYRRFKWAMALLESMADDNEELSVLFYGY